MTDVDRGSRPSAGGVRQLVTGALISGIFGFAWGQWAAGGLPKAASVPVRVATTVIGIAIVIRAARVRRAAPPSGANLFSSTAYRTVVLAEVAVLLGAVIALVATGHERYTPIAVAAVAGVHFGAFGLLFDRFFHFLAAGLLAAAVVGLAVGLRDGSGHTVEAATGLVAAVTLFAGAITRLVVVARSGPASTG